MRKSTSELLSLELLERSSIAVSADRPFTGVQERATVDEAAWAVGPEAELPEEEACVVGPEAELPEEEEVWAVGTATELAAEEAEVRTPPLLVNSAHSQRETAEAASASSAICRAFLDSRTGAG